MGSAYVPTILGIGKAFGIFDDEAIAVADNLPKLAAAFNRNLIPPENWKAAIEGLISDAKDGDVEIGKLLGSMVEFSGDTDPAAKSAKDMALAAEDVVDNFKLIPDSVTPANEKIMRHKEEMAELAQDQMPKAVSAVGDFTDEMDDMLDRYEKMPEKVKPATDKIFEHKEEMAEMAEEQLPKAIEKLGKFTGEMEKMPRRLEPALEATGQLNKTLHEIPGTYRAYVEVITVYKTEGGGDEFQKGGIVPGAIGVPRQVTVHGGEIILNPYQVGAMGGPGGPPPPSNVSTSYGGDTFNVEINDRLSGAMFMSELDSRGRYERLNERM
jgi:hypothetical protein